MRTNFINGFGMDTMMCAMCGTMCRVVPKKDHGLCFLLL
jgi:hypothetical protein